MKQLASVTFCICAFLVCASAADFISATNTLSNDGFSDQQIFETWGWITSHNKELVGIELSPIELSAFLKGFSASVEKQPVPYDLQRAYPDIERLAKARREKLVLDTTRGNEAQAKMFFQELKKRTNVTELPGGLYYEIVRQGYGPLPKPRQTVTVHYTGFVIADPLKQNTEFAQMENYEVVLLTNRLSACLFAGIQKTQKGGAINLYVPPVFSEGNEAALGIPPGSAIGYQIEVLDIKDTSPDDLAIASLPDAPEPPPPPPSGLTDIQIIEAWGWTVAQETHTIKHDMSTNEMDSFTTGLAAGIRDQPVEDLPKIYPIVQKYAADDRMRLQLATKQKRLDEMNTLFTQLKHNTNVFELPDGLRYEIVKAGTGPYPRPGQVVIADYTGRLVDDRVFDRTDNEPLHMQIGLLMPGLNEGLQKINKGGELKLYVPPALGYGDEDSSSVISSVPADSVLIYDIHLLDIQDAPPDSAPK